MRFLLIVLYVTASFAAYNPFFNEQPKKEEKEPEEKVVVKQAPKPQVSPLNRIKVSYFGFLQTNKGQFALLRVQGQTIAIKQGAKLYEGDNRINVVKVSSNSIVLSAKGKYKTVYFSQRE